jgi:hypothetical protein
VQGVVMDAGGRPIAGAVVQIEDLTLLQIRSFVTMANGRYHFCCLSFDREYQLRARYGRVWGSPKTLSMFNSRKQVTLNLGVDLKGEDNGLRERKEL